MFKDKWFNCVTVPAVLKEFVRAKKFKKRYPWRDKLKSCIKTLPLSKLENSSFKIHHTTIENVHDSGKINIRTGRFFDLSRADQRIAAYAITHKYTLSSVDRDLTDFLSQEFEQNSISPLGILNDWIEDGLIKWDQDKHEILEDWERCSEPPQPAEEKQRFHKLTKMKYVGP